MNDNDYIINSYNTCEAVSNYANAIKEIGLWESEKIVFQKFVSKENKILDLCCGAGRTTFNLYDLGYKDIIGVDIANNLINSALEYGKNNGYEIKFLTGDATNLELADNSFHTVFISFNSLMTIPKEENRIKCLRSVARVLKSGGTVIFTTHDREDKSAAKYFDYWKSEKQKFDNGVILDKRIYEFGDKIIYENENIESFLHFPNQKEVRKLLEITGFDLIETKMRYEIASEKQVVKDYSGECRFWIARRNVRSRL